MGQYVHPTEQADLCAESPFDAQEDTNGRYPLSCFDHNPLSMNVTFLLSFRTKAADHSRALLNSSIEKLLKVHPFLAGDVIHQEKLGHRTNVLEIDFAPTQNSLQKCPMLQTQDYPEESIGDLQSNTVLKGPEEHQLMNRLSPLPIDVDINLPRRPVLRFQANVLRDGIILVMTFHHGVMDGAAAARVLGLLAGFCKDPAAEPLPSHPSDIELRGRISPSHAISKQHTTDLSHHYCGLGDWAKLLAQDWPGFLKSRATELMSWRVTISDQKIQYLQETCTAILQRCKAQKADDSSHPEFITKNDVLSALMALILRQTESAYGPKTEMSIAVDVRSKFHPPTFDDYLGNMLMAVYTPITPAPTSEDAESSLVSSQGELRQGYCEEIALIASHIRRSLLALDKDCVYQAIAHLHSRPDWSDIGFRGAPIPLSSFRNFKIFDLDFGESLGRLPCGFQLHLPVLGGMCFVLPRRRDGVSGLEHWDLHLTLSQEEHDVIANSPLFLWATSNEQT